MAFTTVKYATIMHALVSYLRSSVVRPLHWHRKGVGSIPARGPIADEFSQLLPVGFSTVYDFSLSLTHIYPEFLSGYFQ